MKLLQVVHQLPPDHVGGTEVYVRSLSEALRDRGHRVAIFCGGRTFAEECSNGLRLRSVPGGLDPSDSGVGSFFRAFGDRGVEQAFQSLLRQEAPDIVHFHHLAGLSSNLVDIARKARASTVFTLHDYWLLCPNGQLVTPRAEICRSSNRGRDCAICAAHRMGRPYLSGILGLAAPLFRARNRRLWKALQTANVVIAPSRFIGDLFVQHGLRATSLVEVPLGIEPPPIPLTKLSLGAKMRFAYLGSLAWQKGVHILVEAFNQIDPGAAELYIYGDESAFPEYSRRLRHAARSAAIRFMGKLGRVDLWKALSQVDVLAVPSLWYENSPLVINEAFAAGVPVVASNIGALAERVRDGVDGLLFEAGNAAQFLDKVNLLTGNRKLVERLHEGIAPGETMSHHVAAIEELYCLLRNGGDLGRLSGRGRESLPEGATWKG